APGMPLAQAERRVRVALLGGPGEPDHRLLLAPLDAQPHREEGAEQGLCVGVAVVRLLADRGEGFLDEPLALLRVLAGAAPAQVGQPPAPTLRDRVPVSRVPEQRQRPLLVGEPAQAPVGVHPLAEEPPGRERAGLLDALTRTGVLRPPVAGLA